MKYIIGIIIIACLAGCGGKKEKEEPKAGGPCSYRHDTIPARVLAVQKMEDGQYDVQVFRGADRKEPSSRDTIWYSSLNHQHHIADSVIKASNIKEGDTLQFIESQIISGSCNPHITQLKLEKYVKP